MTIVHCCICTAELSEARARRQTSVCSEKCKNKLDALRQEQRATRKCPHCLHPSTPEQRKLFRKFAAQNGEVKSETPLKRDMTWPPKNELRVALRQATGLLRAWREMITGPALGGPTREKVEGIALVDMNEKIPEFERLVDTKAPE